MLFQNLIFNELKVVVVAKIALIVINPLILWLNFWEKWGTANDENRRELSEKKRWSNDTVEYRSYNHQCFQQERFRIRFLFLGVRSLQFFMPFFSRDGKLEFSIQHSLSSTTEKLCNRIDYKDVSEHPVTM